MGVRWGSAPGACLLQGSATPCGVAIDIALPVVLVLMILVIGTSILVLATRSRRQQQRTGQASNERREERDQREP